jgi:hypothetical protein
MAGRLCLIVCACIIAASSTVARGADDAAPDRPFVDQLFSGAFQQVSSLSGVASPESAPSAVIYVRISRDYLAPRFERDVDRKKPLTDEVLGTQIRGTSHTRGKTRLNLLPSTDSVRAEIEFIGTCNSLSRGTNGPAVLRLEADSTFRATKLLVLDDSGFTTLPAKAEADTQQRATDIGTRRNGPFSSIVERVARRRIQETQAEADRIASEHTAERVAKDLDTRLDAAVGTFTERLLAAAGVKPNEIAGLATTPDGQPLKIRLRSTDHHVELALAADECAWEELEDGLPAIDGNPHVALRVHRSFVTHVAANSHKSPAISRLLATGMQAHLAKQTAALVESDAVPAANEPVWNIGLDWVSLDILAADLNHLAAAQ